MAIRNLEACGELSSSRRSKPWRYQMPVPARPRSRNALASRQSHRRTPQGFRSRIIDRRAPNDMKDNGP